MTQPRDDDETADEKFERFEKALKQVLTAPKPPPGKPDDSNAGTVPS